jgi:hypothetical protein
MIDKTIIRIEWPVTVAMMELVIEMMRVKVIMRVKVLLMKVKALMKVKLLI